MKKDHRAFPEMEKLREGARKREGRGGGQVLLSQIAHRIAHTDWLRHDLAINGPAITLRSFTDAAAGAGGIPWLYPNLDHEESDRVHALINPPDGSRGLSPEAARILAHELREASLQHQVKVRAQSRTSRACPFDLHALIPIPPHILQLGPDNPRTIGWMQSNWGVTYPLRHVRIISPKSAPKRRKETLLNLEFWSADWTPWMAFKAIRQNWPDLKFNIQPDYDYG